MSTTDMWMLGMMGAFLFYGGIAVTVFMVKGYAVLRDSLDVLKKEYRDETTEESE
jgi:hypothetical protein